MKPAARKQPPEPGPLRLGLAPGHRVRVYRDALERADLEGEAELVQLVSRRGPPHRPLEDWFLRFGRDLEPVRRLVHPDDRIP